MSDPVRPPQAVQPPLAARAHSPHVAAPPTLAPPRRIEDEPIALVADEIEEAPAVSKIRAFGTETVQRSQKWKRTPDLTGHGAVRVRTFHGKLSEQGMEYVDHAINDWLDNHPEVEVKFVTTTVGQFDGKIREPALILNVWY